MFTDVLQELKDEGLETEENKKRVDEHSRRT